MSNHSNPRFNVTGQEEDGLAATLALWGTINLSSYQIAKVKSPLDFKGYRLDPYLGMVLFQYEIENTKMIPFPFDEGKYPERLASFFYNYLKSDKSKVSIPEKPVGLLDYYADFRADFPLDVDEDHDGHNERGWRVSTGRWGHVLNYDEAIFIRPIHIWYGK
jgi:hypothetical protein